MPKCMKCMRDYAQQKFCPFCGTEGGRRMSDIGQIPEETILNRRFIIGELISADALGFTYTAWDALLERQVAIKEWFPAGIAVREPNRLDVTFRMDPALAQELQQQFLDHAGRLHKMQNISVLVSIYTFFQENHTAYYVMEYLSGQSIGAMLGRENPLEPARAGEIMQKVYAALDTIHKAGLYHGNLTPDNIFLCSDGGIKLLNFGWTSAALEKISYAIFKGSYATYHYYRLPLQGTPDLDRYSACAVYYRMLAGEPPESASMQLDGIELSPISDFGVEIPKETEDGILAGMSMDERAPGGRKSAGLLFLQILCVLLMAAAIALGVILLIQ